MLPTGKSDVNELLLVTKVFGQFEKALMMVVPFEKQFFFVFDFGLSGGHWVVCFRLPGYHGTPNRGAGRAEKFKFKF